MGSTQSHDKPDKELFHDSREHFDENPSSSDKSENPIFEDLLVEILSHVPVRDLIINCRLVCRQWRSVVDAQSVWRLKCERENVKLPSRKFTQLPNHYYRYIYCFSVSKKKNLIRNPCGEQSFNGWEMTTGRSFVIENPPSGADPVPAEVGSQSCFVTTFFDCDKYQVVTLADDAVNKYLLRHDLVKIKVGEWHAARFDCACEYELRVLLFNDRRETIDKFEFRFIEEQWSGREWHLITHEFENVTDAHYVGFYHHGKDRQFWAGHYGSKMTGAFVELLIK